MLSKEFFESPRFKRKFQAVLEADETRYENTLSPQKAETMLYRNNIPETVEADIHYQKGVSVNTPHRISLESDVSSRVKYTPSPNATDRLRNGSDVSEISLVTFPFAK